MIPSIDPARAVSSSTIWPRLRLRVLGIAGRLAVHAQIDRGVFDDAVRLGRDDERVVGQPDVERLAAASQRELDAVGRFGGARGDRDRTLERRDRAAERVDRSLAVRPGDAPSTTGITLASVVISVWMRNASVAMRSA